jgi:hypothetical protein
MLDSPDGRRLASAVAGILEDDLEQSEAWRGNTLATACERTTDRQVAGSPSTPS